MIKGLTHTVERMTRAGKIRLGEKRISKNGKEYPAKLDYFLFDPDPEDAEKVALAKQLYGEKPRKLNIVFASDDVEEVFPQYYKLYSSSGLLCKGTGETAMRVTDEGMVECPCPGPAECEFSLARGVHGKPGCKRLASLQFMLPDWPALEVWQIDTTGFYSIVNVNSTLAMLRRVRGTILGMPLELHLVPQETTNPEDHKKVTIFALKLVIPCSLLEARTLTPLLGFDGTTIETPPLLEDKAPDDLYPRSQIAPAREAARTATAGITLAEDPEIVDAIRACGWGRNKALAFLASAVESGVSRDDVLDDIRRQIPPADLDDEPPFDVEPEPEEAPAPPKPNPASKPDIVCSRGPKNDGAAPAVLF